MLSLLANKKVSYGKLSSHTPTLTLSGGYDLVLLVQMVRCKCEAGKMSDDTIPSNHTFRLHSNVLIIKEMKMRRQI